MPLFTGRQSNLLQCRELRPRPVLTSWFPVCFPVRHDNPLPGGFGAPPLTGDHFSGGCLQCATESHPRDISTRGFVLRSKDESYSEFLLHDRFLCRRPLVHRPLVDPRSARRRMILF